MLKTRRKMGRAKKRQNVIRGKTALVQNYRTLQPVRHANPKQFGATEELPSTNHVGNRRRATLLPESSLGDQLGHQHKLVASSASASANLDYCSFLRFCFLQNLQPDDDIVLKQPLLGSSDEISVAFVWLSTGSTTAWRWTFSTATCRTVCHLLRVFGAPSVTRVCRVGGN